MSVYCLFQGFLYTQFIGVFIAKRKKKMVRTVNSCKEEDTKISGI